jgi:hypothetical protein
MYYHFISGKQTCYSGWKAEYTGILMTEHKSYTNRDYVCVDKDAEPIDSDTSYKSGALLYGVIRIFKIPGHQTFEYDCSTR